jgi:hypothetical protein
MSSQSFPVVKMVHNQPVYLMVFSSANAANHWVRRKPGWVRVGDSGPQHAPYWSGQVLDYVKDRLASWHLKQ